MSYLERCREFSGARPSRAFENTSRAFRMGGSGGRGTYVQIHPDLSEINKHRISQALLIRSALDQRTDLSGGEKDFLLAQYVGNISPAIIVVRPNDIKKIGYIEDDRLLLKAFGRNFNNVETELIECNSPIPEDFEKHLTRIASCQLIFVDFTMPGVNGVKIVRQLRASGYQGWIAGYSGDDFRASALPFLEAGADLVIQKPASLQFLKSLFPWVS